MANERIATRRIRRILRAMLTDHPFFGSLALRLPLTVDRTRQTIASDGQALRFNPDWMAEASADLVRACVAHCVLACALHHHTRRGERDYERWQQASYEATKPILRDAGLTREAGGSDESVERIYDELSDREQGAAGDDSQQQGAAGAADDSDSRGDDGAAGDANEDGDSGGDDGDDDDQDAAGGDDGDQGDDGDSDSETPASADPGNHGEIMDAPLPDNPTDRESAVRAENVEWDEARQQAVQQGETAGNLPGRIAETIKSEHSSSIEWRDELREYLQAVSKDDYSWTRPNRRHVAGGLYLPSLYSEKIPPIALCIDTSLSMDTESLGVVWSEIRDLAETMNPEKLIVIQCDTEVTDISEYEPSDLPETLDAKGRGGTDFRPAFAAIEDLDTPPAVVLYFTDLECWNYPKHAPDSPVVWIVQPTARLAGSYLRDIPFGDVVRVQQ